MNQSPSWTELFRESYIEKYIRLVILAYEHINKKSRKIVKLENARRTELAEWMRKLKSCFHIFFPIAYETSGKLLELYHILLDLTEGDKD